MAQSEAEIQRQKEMQQAEELLFSGRQELGFAKGLFLGNFVADWVMPYPRLDATRQAELESALNEVRQMLDRDLDPDWIDRNADIPQNLIDGLARTGVLGMTAAREFGGRGFSQMQCCRILEEIGKRDASTSVFVNAHHAIGIRALLLFGTREQKAQWLPSLVAGEKLAAFALTEREAGSDAANVRMTATPSEDGSHYILNGEKRYITNAAVSEVWTVMARTPVPDKPGKDAITAFLVTPDTAGVEMIEGRMPKIGIRGTATGRFRLKNVRVPKENILGPLGKGLRVALTVLDFGRTTFGACCTGGAKHCLQLAIEHANSRQQFKKTLGNFDLVKKKIARMTADIYAMEAMTNVTASLIDRGLEDYMIETAMLKVFATVRTPNVPVQSAELRGFAGQLGRLIWRFNVAVNRALVVYREPVLDMQLIQERIAGAAMELFASTCALSRWDSELQARGRNGETQPFDFTAPKYFLRKSIRHAKELLTELNDNDDHALLDTANAALGATK